MTTQSPTLVRCERCRAVISSAEATSMIRHGVPCGVCGGTLSLCDGRPVALDALSDAGIEDPANAIYELERAGHRIEREYAEVTTGRRRLLGYRLRGSRSFR